MAEASWVEIVRTTIRDHIREQTELILRRNRLLAMLLEKGRIVLNCGGDGFDWPVRYKRAQLQTYSELQRNRFNRQQEHERPYLRYVQYVMTKAWSKKDQLANKGVAAIVKVFGDGAAKQLEDDLKQAFPRELYVDSTDTNNVGRLTGIESMMGRSGTVNANGVCQPSATYAGLSTALSAKGGDGTASTWPDSDCSDQFDYWSPLILSYTHNAAWGGSGFDTWAENAKKVLNYLTVTMMRYDTMDGEKPIFLSARDLYYQLLNLLNDQERIIVSNTSNSKLVKLGFGDVINWNGMDVTPDGPIASGRGYGIDTSAVELRSMQEDLFGIQGPELDFDLQAWKMLGDCYAQLKFESPNRFSTVGAFGS